MKYDFWNRLFDFIIALFLIIILSPIIIFIYLFVLIRSGTPVLYSHERMGKDGRRFRVYKFRTMKRNARALHKKGFSNSELVTIEGRALRKLHFDELLQLFNILKGDMSIVGPRPLDVSDYKKHLKQDGKYSVIYYHTKPGLTGLNSVLTYIDIKTRKKIMKKLGLRLTSDKKKHPKNSKKYHAKKKEREFYYAFNKSFSLDLRIIVWTVILELKIFIKMLINIFSRDVKK